MEFPIESVHRPYNSIGTTVPHCDIRAYCVIMAYLNASYIAAGLLTIVHRGRVSRSYKQIRQTVNWSVWLKAGAFGKHSDDESVFATLSLSLSLSLWEASLSIVASLSVPCLALPRYIHRVSKNMPFPLRR